MPTTINDLISSIGLDAKKIRTVKWGESPDSSSIGIYIVSTEENPNENSNLFEKAPISDDILRFWLGKVSSLQIDAKQKPSIPELRERLSGFWLPDENIIYIGQTESKKGLRGRVNQYYDTEIGDRKPHAGGHWIKTLSILNQLFVHYIPNPSPRVTEEKLLHKFIEQVSEKTRKELFNSTLPIPFANLELEKGNRKLHGISKSKLSD